MITTDISRALTLPRLDSAAFVASKWYSPEDKAKFGNHLLRFIGKGFPQHLFTKAFYRLLSNHFGHIAHYSAHGFWDHYFTDDRSRFEFLNDTVLYVVCGDPTYTFSDVERAVQRRLQQSGVLDWQERAAHGETEALERALLRKLQAKYEARPVMVAAAHSSEAPASARVQDDLFA
jgi:hypothetical protein